MFIFEFNREDYLAKFGERVKAYRTALGMSQQELAEASGYTSRTSIAKIEAGKTDVPRAKVDALAAALEVSPTELMIDDVKAYTINDEVLEIAKKIQRLDPLRKKLVMTILDEQ